MDESLIAALLDGLHDIDWSALGMAYGPATGVPDLIRGLASSDARARKESVESLWGTIFHQGSRYEAAAYAVPFLLRLLAEPAVADRAAIAELLAGLAIGFDDMHLPHPVPIAAMRAQAAAAPAKDPPPPRERGCGGGWTTPRLITGGNWQRRTPGIPGASCRRGPGSPGTAVPGTASGFAGSTWWTCDGRSPRMTRRRPG